MTKLSSFKKYSVSKIKGNRIITAIFTLAIVFIITFFLNNLNLNASISLAFTAIASISTVLTLLIAIKLYDQYGLKNLFTTKQAEKLLELVDALSKQRLTLNADKGIYLLRFNIRHLKTIKLVPEYKNDKEKQVLIDYANYAVFYQKIILIGRSQWIPMAIQEKMTFLDFAATSPTTFHKTEHMKLEFFEVKDKPEWSMTVPELTVEDLITQLISLAESIDAWFKEHAEIELPLPLSS